jgi:cystathionine gamma-synthase
MTDPDLGASRPLAPPLYTASVYGIPDLDVLDRIMEGDETGFFYARDAHPNGRDFAARLAEFETGTWGQATASGMAAISLSLLTLLEKGGRIVASDRLYGRTAQVIGQELARFGVQAEWVDATDPAAVRQALSLPAAVLYVETISNPLLRVTNLPALADLAHDGGARLVVDNTFATPVLARPLEFGADLVIESVTKFIGGHSDVTLGVVCGRDSDVGARVQRLSSIWGLAANPFDCWLATRGLPTLELRVRAASANAAVLADWLVGQRGVARVVYPGRPDHPDHGLARGLLPEGGGHVLCFELDGGREAVNRFVRRAPGVPLSPSLGHATTTCSHPATTSHRFVPPAERQRQGIGDGLVRLSVGVEPLDLVQEALRYGLR